LEMTIDEFDRTFCAGRIATGDVERHSTQMVHLDMEATEMLPRQAIRAAYSAINIPWTVLSAKNVNGGQALDAARERLVSLAERVAAGTWKPPVPKGPLGRHAMLLRSAIEQVDFPSGPDAGAAPPSGGLSDRPAIDRLVDPNGSNNPTTLQELNDVSRV
jgi:hypothetical protein